MAIKTSYSPTAGTAFVTFDNVRVPVENTLGPEGGGIFVILSNFNHERWVMICASARAQRMILEECLKWVSQRKAFGKPLSSQAVVRAKLAEMIARAEAVQSWLENVTYQMCNMVRRDHTFALSFRVPSSVTRANDHDRRRSRTRNKRRISPARSLS